MEFEIKFILFFMFIRTEKKLSALRYVSTGSLKLLHENGIFTKCSHLVQTTESSALYNKYIWVLKFVTLTTTFLKQFHIFINEIN